MVLTDLGIRKLPLPDKGQKTYWDKGLGVRVSQGGAKSFVAKHKGKFITLGKYPAMSLKMARNACFQLKTDETPLKRIQRLDAAISAYLGECEHKNRPATVRQYRHFLAQVDRTYLTDVQRTDVDLGSAHAVMAWRVFFNWCIRNELIDRNPFAYVKVSWSERTRLLTDDEIVKLWHYDHSPYSDYLKAMILTGQRVGQFKQFTIDETVTFPASVMKNKREHVLPATNWVVEVLERLVPFNGWSRAKRRCDTHTGVTDWVQHDCRRYYSSTQAKLGTPLHVTERILSHAGEVSGVAAVYNRYNFLDEPIEPLHQARVAMSEQYDRFKAHEVGDYEADAAIMSMYRNGVINVQRIAQVANAWDNPPHDWGDKTGWRLFNAATYALTGRVAEDPRITHKLHDVVDGVCKRLN